MRLCPSQLQLSLNPWDICSTGGGRRPVIVLIGASAASGIMVACLRRFRCEEDAVVRGEGCFRTFGVTKDGALLLLLFLGYTWI